MKKQSGVCCIITGGEFYLPPQAKNADFVIACDKGYEYALRGNITPNLVVGDFDSSPKPDENGFKIKTLPCEKDDTDTMVAVKEALARGYKIINIYCAFGGRCDHFIANLQAACYAVRSGAKVRITGLYEDFYVFSNSSMTLKKQKGRSLSLFALSDKCTGVSVSGAKWELSNATLTSAYPVGVSNEWVLGEVEITAGEGVLAVVSSEMRDC